MATIREFEVKANTEEAVKSIEELKHELEESKEKANELEEALADANKEAAKGSKEAAASEREAARAKEEVVRTIDRATGGYLEMGKKAGKAYKVIKTELVNVIAKSKAWIASISWSGIVKGVKSFGTALQASFKAGTLGAKALKGALAATGIGLAVVAIGSIAENWDSIKKSAFGYNKAADKALESATKAKEAQQASLEAIDASENILREQGKSEEEIQKMKEAQTQEVIKASKAELAATKLKRKAEQESYEKQKGFVKGMLEFLLFVPRTILRMLDRMVNALPGWARDLLGIGRSNMAGALDDMIEATSEFVVGTAEEATAETDALIAEQEAGIRELENKAAGYRLDRREKQQEAYKKAEEDAKKHAEALAKIEQDTAEIRRQIWENSAEDAKAREVRRFVNEGRRLQLQRQQEIAAAEGNQELINAIREKYRAIAEQAQEQHNDNIEKINEDATQNELDRLDKLEDLRLELMDEGKDKELEALELKYTRLMEAEMGNLEALKLLQDNWNKEQQAVQDKYDKEAIKKRKDYQNQIADIVLESANATIKNLMDLNQLYDENDKAAAKRAFERNKSLQIVQAIINTAGGIMGQLNVPQDQLTGANWVKAALIATTGATQIATISAQQFNEGKAAGGAAPKAPTVPQVAPSFNIVGQSNTNQLLQGIAGQFANPLRAYVVGGDITSSQEMERKRIKTATFG